MILLRFSPRPSSS